MFRKRKTILFFGLAMLLLANGSFAQNEISQPYSIFGVGVVNKASNGIQNGMGGASYAMQSPYYINFRNPASYAAFDSLSFVADVAASVHVSTLAAGNTGVTQKNTYVRPDYLAIGLPVTRHWRTSVGLVPFSTIGYDMVSSRTVDPIGEVSYEYSGKGGLNQLYWGNAFRLCKGLSIGLNAAYMFGSIYNYSRTEFEGSNFYNTNITDAYHLDGIYLNAGLQYVFKVKDKHQIGLGAVYGNTAYIWARENLLISYYQGTYSTVTTYDTALCDNTPRGNLHIPQSVGGGLSYTYKDKISLAADVTWNNWSRYKFMQHSDSLQDAIAASVGFQYVSDPLSPKFFKRLAVRVGAHYSTGEFFLRDKPVSEFGVSAGIGIPLTTFNTHSSINLVFEYGKTGTMVNELVRQNYFRFTLCFTLQEKWYQRMKIE